MKKMIALVAAICLAAGFVHAAEWNFYGSVRLSTFVTDNDTADTKDYSQTLQTNSRIGAKIKVNDELRAVFEYGTGVDIRQLYGEWDFGAGTFLVGKGYVPLCIVYSNQVYGNDINLKPYGGIYSGLQSMLRLKFGGFEIAAVEPNTSFTAGVTGTSTERDMPAIEASYRLTMNNFNIHAGAGYSTFDVISGGTSHSVDSWLIGLGAGLKLNAFYLGGSIFTGTNVGNLTPTNTSGSGNSSLAFFDGTDMIDNDAMGYVFSAGFKANDMFSFEAGYGHAATEYDTAGSTEDEVESYYLQSTITLAKGVTITPEIGRIDFKEAGQRDDRYFGAKWQINF